MRRPILIGYVGLESWADDYSEWDGAIVGGENPKGANAFWSDPIPMIEKRAYDRLLETLRYIRSKLRQTSSDRDLDIVYNSIDPAIDYVSGVAQPVVQEGKKE